MAEQTMHGLVVSVQTREITGQEEPLVDGPLGRLEWLNIFSQGVSNEPHWYNADEPMQMEAKTSNLLHMELGDANHLASSLIKQPSNAASNTASTQVHINSWQSRILPRLKKTMGDGGFTIGNNVLQLVDPFLYGARY
jgi:hypothetical protein